MIKPFSVTFHVYAEDTSEVKQLENALYDFVIDKYQDNVFVTAAKIQEAIRTFGNNPIIKQYFL